MSAAALPHPPIPRALYAGIMAIATLVAFGVGLWVADRNGADGPVLMSIAVALAAVASLTIIPLLGESLIRPDRWGLSVLACSGIRTLIAMGAMLILIEAQGLPRKPVVYGVFGGSIVLLVIEAAAAVWLLNRQTLSYPPAASTPGEQRSAS